MLPISFLWMWLFLICIRFRMLHHYGRPIPHMLSARARSTVKVWMRRAIVMTSRFCVSVRVRGLLGRRFIEFPRLVVYTANWSNMNMSYCWVFGYMKTYFLIFSSHSLHYQPRPLPRLPAAFVYFRLWEWEYQWRWHLQGSRSLHRSPA